jgi:hypothetical protein
MCSNIIQAIFLHFALFIAIVFVVIILSIFKNYQISKYLPTKMVDKKQLKTLLHMETKVLNVLFS